MKTQGWPSWAIVVQSIAGLAFVAIVLAIDDAYRTAELRSMVGMPQAGAVWGFDWLGLVYLWPYIVLGFIMYVVFPASIISYAFLLVGLPIRLIPVVRSWWVRSYASFVLLAVSFILLAVAWLVLPAAHIEVSTYQPSSPLFVVGAVIGTFAVWHLWLPRRRDVVKPAPRPVEPRGEEWRLGRIL